VRHVGHLQSRSKQL